MPITIAHLRASFLCDEDAGWVAVLTRDDGCARYFRTNRLAKLMPDGELHFTIGATQRGTSFRLNEFIERRIRDAGLAVLDRCTTSGNRESQYPAIDTHQATEVEIIGVLLSVENEAKRIYGDVTGRGDT